MTTLEKGCQGKVARLPLHYNWPRPTPHGFWAGQGPPAVLGPWMRGSLDHSTADPDLVGHPAR